MREISLHHLTMLDAHPLELIDAAATGGFSHVGLRMVPPQPGDRIVEVAGDAALVDALEARLRSTGVRLFDVEAVWLQPTTDVELLESVLDVACRLGARQVLTVGMDPDATRLTDNFCRLCEIASRLDMLVALEFITYCSIGTLDQAIGLIGRSAQPNARLMLDALQFFRSRAKVGELATVDPAWLTTLQLCDAPAIGPADIEGRRREARTERLLPGEGGLPLASLLHSMPRDIMLSVEAPTLALAGPGLHFGEQARIIGEATRRFLGTCGSACSGN